LPLVVHEKVFTGIQTHERHRTEIVVGFVLKENQGVDGSSAGKFVHSHISHMEFGRKTEIVAGANFFAGVTVFVHGNDLFKHIFFSKKNSSKCTCGSSFGDPPDIPPLHMARKWQKTPLGVRLGYVNFDFYGLEVVKFDK
jgi:hypothetical protein